MSRRQRIGEVKAFVALCLSTLGDDSRDIAQRTGLSRSTVQRLSRGRISLATHVGTIQALSQAAGLRMFYDARGRARMEAA